MTRIDAHHHLWDLDAVSYPWLMASGVKRFFGDPTPIQRNYLVDDLKADASPHGIAQTVHVQVGAADPWHEAAWVDAQAGQHPGWPAAQVVFCDLTQEGRDAQLDQFATLPTVKGVRMIVGRAPWEDDRTQTDALLADPRFLDGLRAVAARGWSFDLQLIPEQMERVALLLGEVPDLQVALCHCGSPHDRSADGLAQWEQSLRSLSALPHVTCKLSGLGMFEHDWTADSIRPIVETCLEQFTPDRCMFGSNFPVDSLYSDYTKLIRAYEALIPRSAQGTVFHDTAKAFYGLQ